MEEDGRGGEVSSRLKGVWKKVVCNPFLQERQILDFSVWKRLYERFESWRFNLKKDQSSHPGRKMSHCPLHACPASISTFPTSDPLFLTFSPIAIPHVLRVTHAAAWPPSAAAWVIPPSACLFPNLRSTTSSVDLIMLLERIEGIWLVNRFVRVRLEGLGGNVQKRWKILKKKERRATTTGLV